jgi:hypothetical protein
MLRALRRAGVACPDWVATGEDDAGRAFVLVRAVEGGRDLRAFLGDPANAAPDRRRALAQRLGQVIAGVHRAGFDHPDLYSKHVLVRDDGSLALLDWQRCGRRRLTRRRRIRALAKLNASLGDGLAGRTDRLACLRAYLRATGLCGRGVQARMVRGLLRETQRLLRRPRLREMRQPLMPDGGQELVWLDGEALCVTQAFAGECRGAVRDRLYLPRDGARRRDRFHRCTVQLPGGRTGRLERRSTSSPFAWLWRRLRRLPWVAPEVARAGTLFRLQRAGIATVGLLAFGQRPSRPWQTDSFLLTATPVGHHALGWWVHTRGRRSRGANRCRSHAHLLRAVADVLRRLHEAGFALCPNRSGWLPDATFMVGPPADRPTVLVADLAGVERCRRVNDRRRRRDLLLLARLFREGGCSRTDLLRLNLAYVNHRRLTPDDRRRLCSRLPRELAIPLPAPWLGRSPAGSGTEEPVHEPGAVLPECAAGARRL